MSTPRISYYCKENENHFFMDFVDGELDEIRVGDALSDAWIIIGFKDFKDGLKKAGYEVKKG